MFNVESINDELTFRLADETTTGIGTRELKAVMPANTSRRSPRGVTCVTHRKSQGPVRPARCPGQRGACVGAADDAERSPLTAGWCWT